MKTLELNLPTPVLLVWGLPEDASDIKVIYNKSTMQSRLCYNAEFVGENRTMYTALINGNWQLIGKLSEVTEEWCKGVAPFCPVGSGKYMDWTIKHTDCMECNTALESFQSAIESERIECDPEHTLILEMI